MAPIKFRIQEKIVKSEGSDENVDEFRIENQRIEENSRESLDSDYSSDQEMIQDQRDDQDDDSEAIKDEEKD